MQIPIRSVRLVNSFLCNLLDRSPVAAPLIAVKITRKDNGYFSPWKNALDRQYAAKVLVSKAIVVGNTATKHVPIEVNKPLSILLGNDDEMIKETKKQLKNVATKNIGSSSKLKRQHSPPNP